MQPGIPSIWSHDSNETASGKPEMLQFLDDGRVCLMSNTAERPRCFPLGERHGYSAVQIVAGNALLSSPL